MTYSAQGTNHPSVTISTERVDGGALTIWGAGPAIVLSESDGKRLTDYLSEHYLVSK